MQNSLAEWDRMVSEGIYRVPYPVETRLSLVDLDDVAEAAAIVLTSDGHSGARYELVGTPPLSQDEIAEIFGRVLKRAVRAVAESVEDWDRRARAAGLSDFARDTLTKMFRSYARDGLKGNANVLGWLLGRPPTSAYDRHARRRIHPLQEPPRASAGPCKNQGSTSPPSPQRQACRPRYGFEAGHCARGPPRGQRRQQAVQSAYDG